MKTIEELKRAADAPTVVAGQGQEAGAIPADFDSLNAQVRTTLGKMSMALSAIDEAIVWTSEKGIIQWSNTQFDDLVAKPRLRVLGAKLIDLLPLEQGDRPCPPETHPANLALTTRRRAKELFYEFRQGGRKLILEVYSNYVQLNTEESAAVFVIRDVTKRRQAEEQLMEANAKLTKGEKVFFSLLSDLKESSEKLKAMQGQLIQAAKMESVGRLAAGAAHEVKNPLAILQQGVDYLSAKIKLGDPSVAGVLHEMAAAVANADSVIRGLLDFARLSQLNLEVSELPSLIERALLLVNHQCDQLRIEIVKEFQTDLPAVKVDKNRIEQVFVNLLLNAIQAMPKGGQLRIKAYTKKLTESGSQTDRRNEDTFGLGETIVVDIEDTGSGIRENLLPKIFDPFFTTKRDFGGTGLGLAVVRNIMEMHRGTIQIGNRTEGGVKATLMLKTRQEKEERPE